MPTNAFCTGEIVYHFYFYTAKGMRSEFQDGSKEERPNY